MKLRAPARVRPQPPASPLASLSLLLLSTVVVTGLFAAARGPGMRFATPIEASTYPEAEAIHVTIQRGGLIEVDGVTVEAGDLASAVGARRSGREDAPALLIVSPDATYGDMIAAYGTLASGPHPLRVAIPTRAWITARETP